jgi:hypothetical protein
VSVKVTFKIWIWLWGLGTPLDGAATRKKMDALNARWLKYVYLRRGVLLSFPHPHNLDNKGGAYLGAKKAQKAMYQ